MSLPVRISHTCIHLMHAHVHDATYTSICLLPPPAAAFGCTAVAGFTASSSPHDVTSAAAYSVRLMLSDAMKSSMHGRECGMSAMRCEKKTSNMEERMAKTSITEEE